MILKQCAAVARQNATSVKNGAKTQRPTDKMYSISSRNNSNNDDSDDADNNR